MLMLNIFHIIAVYVSRSFLFIKHDKEVQEHRSVPLNQILKFSGNKEFFVTPLEVGRPKLIRTHMSGKP